MELKKLLQYWNSFPEMSMEERPVLSSDLEKIVVKNPLSDAFYLRRKLLLRIAVMSILWLLNIWQLHRQWVMDGNDLHLQFALFVLLGVSLYYHVRLLFFANYPTLLALPLVNFLAKLEIILDKYIVSFKFVSAISGFYILSGIEWTLSRISPGASASISGSDWYKGLILITLALSLDMLIFRTIVPKQRKLMETVKKYREGILARSQTK
jgi:hypothetical protein